MKLTPSDLWALRNIIIRTVKEAHEVLAEAARRERAARRADDNTRAHTERPDARPRPPPAAAPAGDRIAYTIREACHALGLSRSTLYKLIGDGRLSATRIAGRRLVTKAALESFLSSSREHSGG